MAAHILSDNDRSKFAAMYMDFMSRVPGGQGRPGTTNPPNDPQEEWFRVVSNDGGGAYTVQRQIWTIAAGWTDDATAQYTAQDYRLAPAGLAGQTVRGWRAYDSAGNWRVLIDLLGGGGGAGTNTLVKIISHQDRDNNNQYKVQQCNPDGTTMTGSSLTSGIANLRETGCAVLASGALVQAFLHVNGEFYIDHHAGYLFRAEVTVVPGGTGYHLKIVNVAGNIPAGAVALTDFTVCQDLNQRSLFIQLLDVAGGNFDNISTAVPGLTWTAAGGTGLQTDWLPVVGDTVWALVRPAPYGDRWIMHDDQWDLGNY